MKQDLLSFFYDPILRAPTLGCMLMCLAASLMGVIVLLRKQSLIGEALSHASYPGIIIGIVIAGLLNLGEGDGLYISFLILAGAFITSLLGVWLIYFLEARLRVPVDSALCFILSTSFGVGLTIASEVQFSFTSLYKQALTYLYGQAATMTDKHIAIYAVLSLVIVTIIILFYKEIQSSVFDKEYAKSLGLPIKLTESIIFVFVTLSIIVGVRSVGVVLMSAMLIAPPVAARQFTNRLSILFVLSALIGVSSGFFGNYFSVKITQFYSTFYSSSRIVLPTGPMIVIVATFICILALLFAPERGLIIRLCRIGLFRYRCLCENILKAIWRNNPSNSINIKQIKQFQNISYLYLKMILWRMVRNGWLKNQHNEYSLTLDGQHRAAKIIRLHRLWEVYLVNFLGVGSEKVHRSAEEMEHILTPELEKELTILLNDPKEDPHQQPIPGQKQIYGS